MHLNNEVNFKQPDFSDEAICVTLFVENYNKAKYKINILTYD